MSRQFIINTSHHLYGNVYRLNIPKGIILTSNHEVCLSSCSFFNSSFNMMAKWGNNKIIILSDNFNLNSITLNSTVTNKGTVYTDPRNNTVIYRNFIEITFKDGYYDIPSIENYLQNAYQLIGFLLESTDAQSNMFFTEFITNPQLYKAQINIAPIPSVLPTDFQLPSNACFSLGASDSSPYIYFPAGLTSSYGGINDIFGFNNQCLPSTPNNENRNINTTTATENLSIKTPKVSPITCYVVGCSIVRNDLFNPSDILAQLSLGQSKFGGIIPYSDYPIFITCENQNTKNITIHLYDEYLNELEFQDKQMSLVLTIKENKIYT